MVCFDACELTLQQFKNVKKIKKPELIGSGF